MKRLSIYDYSLHILLAGSVLAIQIWGERPDIGHPFTSNFWFLGLMLGLALLGYGLLLNRAKDPLSEKMSLRLGVALRLALIFTFPHLSDDFYRYVWDGRMILAGHNPYDLLPSDWMAQLSPTEQPLWQDLFAHLNSPNYYSVYPPVLQGFFALAAWVSGGDPWGAAIALRVMVVAAELGTIWLLGKILKQIGLPSRHVLLYALNPMVLLELTGNIHGEAFMLFFLVLAIWVLMRHGYWLASVPLTLAIGSKLLPVLIFPFLIKRLGWRKTIILGGSTALLCLGMFAILLSRDNVPHFLESLRLYFQYFEFNAGLYQLLRWPLGDAGHWVNRLLPWLMMGLILVSAWRERNRDWTGLGPAMLLALTLYQLHSPVVHPWYITPLVGLAVLGRYRFAVVWSVLLPFTYFAYFLPERQAPTWLVVIEYGLLFGWMAYEWLFVRPQVNLSEWLLARPWFRRLVMRSIPARLRIKQARIARHLAREVRVLDLGSGHGGLCQALRQDGFDITPVDVKNLSFFPDVQPIVYDGQRLPFDDQAFDTTLLITILHHTPDPEAVVREALRVTRRRLVIMEDIYSNALQRELTFFTDSLVNLEFEGHPHTNKSDEAWQQLFAQLGLKLSFREDFRTLVFFRQVIYVLDRP